MASWATGPDPGLLLMAAGPRPAEVMIGLDVGTTAVKAVAFGLASGFRQAAIREYPLLEPRPGWQEQDPDGVMEATVEALREVVATTSPAKVLGVSLSAAMHGLIGLDQAGQPITPLITWADSRAWAEAAALRRTGEAVELRRRSGTPVHPMTPLTKLMWFSRHAPRICADARWWVGLKDYLLLRLTGTLATELSSASGTGLLDMAAHAWDPEAMKLAGVSAAQLPPILATTAVLALAAPAAALVGLPAGTPVIPGAGDGPLGNLGTGAMARGVAGLSLGTSGAVRMVFPEPRLDALGTLFCYALTDSAWVVGGAVSNGGFVVRWAEHSLAPDLRGSMASGTADEELLRLAGAVPAGCDGLVMLPYLLAERAPLWDPELPGAYLGLHRAHTRAHLVRAAVEGVCLQLRLILDQLDQLEPVSSVRVTGGAFRAHLWREIMAATLDRPLHVVEDAEGTALGAAALGLFALGRVPELAVGVGLLSARGTAGSTRIDADPDLVAAYRRVRASVPGLIEALGPVARLFAAHQPAAAAAGRLRPIQPAHAAPQAPGESGLEPEPPATR
ncbi:MAG: gluconokinase [Candidatus Dormibacteraeota bacterium]|nr:gluconokinase [Candidatus Dormibacteraeota bacterium]